MKKSQICHNKVYHIQKSFIDQLYKSKFSKKKLTDLSYIIDKNHNDSKLCQKVTIRKNLVHKLLFVHAQILETIFLYSQIEKMIESYNSIF